MDEDGVSLTFLQAASSELEIFARQKIKKPLKCRATSGVGSELARPGPGLPSMYGLLGTAANKNPILFWQLKALCRTQPAPAGATVDSWRDIFAKLFELCTGLRFLRLYPILWFGLRFFSNQVQDVSAIHRRGPGA